MVQVPRLQRIQNSPAQPANDRINLQARDQASNILGNTQAITGIAKEATDLYYDIEDQKITQMSYEAEQQYKEWNATKLGQLKSFEGDPTDAYAQYDEEEKEKFEELINARPDVSERVKNNLKANLTKVQNSQRIAVLKQRGAQQETYENNLFESTVKLKRDDLSVNAGYVRKDDPGSFLLFDQGLADVKTVIAQRAVKKGTAEVLPEDAESWTHAYRDAEGKVIKVKMNDIAKQRVAQELSKGVVTSIENMIASGYTDEAKLMQERYKGYIDPINAGKLKTKFKDVDIKDEAFAFMGGINGKNEADQMAAIDKISNPELRSEVLKIKDTDDNRRESIRKRQQESNYNVLANRVLEKMNSPNPYYGMADLENDPLYKQTWDKLDPKQKKTILESVKAPDKTDEKAEIAIQNLFFGNDENYQLDTIPPEQFQTYLTGLNSADRKKYTNEYNRLRIESAGEQRSTFKRAEKMLSDQLFLIGYLKKNDYNAFDQRSQKRMIEANNELMDYLSTQNTANMSDKELKDFVIKYSAAKAKDEAFSPPPRPTFKPVNTSNSNAQSTVNPEDSLSQSEKLRLRRAYKTEFGEWPNLQSQDYQDFLRNNL